MKRLHFRSWSGTAGRFSAIRVGHEVLADMTIGEEIELATDGDVGPLVVGYAAVVDGWGGDLALVPGSIMEMEQDPLGRTYSGLIIKLRSEKRGEVNGVVPEPIQPGTKVSALILDFTRASQILRAVRG